MNGMARPQSKLPFATKLFRVSAMLLKLLVDLIGIEPMTSSMPSASTVVSY
jgi:hypothetical protein